MVAAARWVYLVLVWIYLAAILWQVFLAGIALFTTEPSFEAHRNLGYLLHLVPLLLLIVAAVARVGPTTILWNVGLLIVQGVQPLLPSVRNDLPWAAALHPVLALVIFWLALTIGVRAWRLAREPVPASTPASQP
jgi:Family of unknown function (DUF6220)